MIMWNTIYQHTQVTQKTAGHRHDGASMRIENPEFMSLKHSENKSTKCMNNQFNYSYIGSVQRKSYIFSTLSDVAVFVLTCGLRGILLCRLIFVHFFTIITEMDPTGATHTLHTGHSKIDCDGTCQISQQETCITAFAHHDSLKSSFSVELAAVCTLKKGTFAVRSGDWPMFSQRWEEEVHLLSLLAPPTPSQHTMRS